MPAPSPHPASYRDPSGFIFEEEGVLFRQINLNYASHYEKLMQSGLYEALVGRGWLISHEEIKDKSGISEDCFRVIRPERIFYINYPYEWCFSQLKEAALLTLDIMKLAMDHGMILKDATSFNVMYSFRDPVFIDSLSFETYDETRPWKAYRQFCETFLAPLLLGAYREPGLIGILRLYPSGIPLSMAARLLPLRSRFSSLAGLHIHLQARIAEDEKKENKQVLFSKEKLSRIIEHLKAGISRLKPAKTSVAWQNYYREDVKTGYLEEKGKIFQQILENLQPESILDLGCNTGYFSALAGERGIPVVAIDSDHGSIESFFRSQRKNKSGKVLSLCIDLTNPSPQIGWNNQERLTLFQRIKFDLVLAFALVHHLALKEMVPFERIAGSFYQLTKSYVLVEFMDPADDRVVELIKQKEGIVKPYSRDQFLGAFEKYFHLELSISLKDSTRVLYLFQKTDHAL